MIILAELLSVCQNKAGVLGRVKQFGIAAYFPGAMRREGFVCWGFGGISLFFVFCFFFFYDLISDAGKSGPVLGNLPLLFSLLCSAFKPVEFCCLSRFSPCPVGAQSYCSWFRVGQSRASPLQGFCRVSYHRQSVTPGPFSCLPSGAVTSKRNTRSTWCSTVGRSPCLSSTTPTTSNLSTCGTTKMDPNEQ